MPVAGEVLPWKLSRFGPECAHVPLFTVLIVLFLSLVEGREYLFFFSNSLNFEFLFTLLFSVLLFVFLSFQYSHMSLAVLELNMFFWTYYYTFILVELLV